MMPYQTRRRAMKTIAQASSTSSLMTRTESHLPRQRTLEEALRIPLPPDSESLPEGNQVGLNLLDPPLAGSQLLPRPLDHRPDLVLPTRSQLDSAVLEMEAKALKRERAGQKTSMTAVRKRLEAAIRSGARTAEIRTIVQELVDAHEKVRAVHVKIEARAVTMPAKQDALAWIDRLSKERNEAVKAAADYVESRCSRSSSSTSAGGAKASEGHGSFKSSGTARKIAELQRRHDEEKAAHEEQITLRKEEYQRAHTALEEETKRATLAIQANLQAELKKLSEQGSKYVLQLTEEERMMIRWMCGVRLSDKCGTVESAGH